MCSARPRSPRLQSHHVPVARILCTNKPSRECAAPAIVAVRPSKRVLRSASVANTPGARNVLESRPSYTSILMVTLEMRNPQRNPQHGLGERPVKGCGTLVISVRPCISPGKRYAPTVVRRRAHKLYGTRPRNESQSLTPRLSDGWKNDWPGLRPALVRIATGLKHSYSAGMFRRILFSLFPIDNNPIDFHSFLTTIALIQRSRPIQESPRQLSFGNTTRFSPYRVAAYW